MHSSSCVSSRRRATRRARTPAEARLLPSEFARAARGLGLDARAQLSPARRPETAPAHWAPRSSSSRGWSSPGGACAHAPTAPPGKKSRGSRKAWQPPREPSPCSASGAGAKTATYFRFRHLFLFRSSRTPRRPVLRLHPPGWEATAGMAMFEQMRANVGKLLKGIDRSEPGRREGFWSAGWRRAFLETARGWSGSWGGTFQSSGGDV